MLFFSNCNDDTAPNEISVPKPRPTVKAKKFEADSAYQYIEKQLSFGTRVPNSFGHQQCKEWLVSKFNSFGATVIEQDFQAPAHTGEIYNGTNIIAQYNVDDSDRILLMAHWDTRAIAEKDPDESRRDEPIAGADDGASGVAVLLEIARHLHENPISIGVDIILFDAEDNGKNDTQTQADVNTWCLGSQYWSKNKHKPNYTAAYGILLDMVGAKDAQFTKERASREFAPQLVQKVWDLASRMGKEKYFQDINTPEVIDDHSFVNAIARIPSLCILNHPLEQMFGDHHHTHRDDIDIIDKNTLAAVGQVVLAVIYQTNNGTF